MRPFKGKIVVNAALTAKSLPTPALPDELKHPVTPKQNASLFTYAPPSIPQGELNLKMNLLVYQFSAHFPVELHASFFLPAGCWMCGGPHFAVANVQDVADDVVDIFNANHYAVDAIVHLRH
ncbi:hypothetical protein HELRODRAFT_163300 [Helobdella robusta]|uniref:Uncharacterized protein n=1 Tax=Helobdella robusta TaxID=6412 RepID=T1ETV7_HELRO|nr:hypothetical protein HELRODRAFT_163300 [Helobdella robusta]ESN96255.1 hypothetical protein HELRODRAFT_163300 [Helobdella robusta]